MRQTHTDKVLAELEAERDDLTRLIDRLREKQTVKPARVATGRKPGRPRKLAEAEPKL